MEDIAAPMTLPRRPMRAPLSSKRMLQRPESDGLHMLSQREAFSGLPLLSAPTADVSDDLCILPSSGPDSKETRFSSFKTTS